MFHGLHTRKKFKLLFQHKYPKNKMNTKANFINKRNKKKIQNGLPFPLFVIIQWTKKKFIHEQIRFNLNPLTH